MRHRLLSALFAGLALPAALAAEAPSPKPPPGATILFDGKDTSAWQMENGKTPIAWTVEGGVLTVAPKKGSIVTKETYQDFRLHLEFCIPKTGDGVKGQGKGNSGVYIQRRYEVQILDSHGVEPPEFNGCASLYRQKAPSRNVCKPAGEWQTYDITFRGARFDASGKKTGNARITVIHNGVKVHDDYEVTNKTGAGQKEGPDPGPIKLQDHGNPVQFRNIWIVPGKP
jgi:hypothetical protein